MSYFFLRHLSGNEIDKTFDPVTSNNMKLKAITVGIDAAATTSEDLTFTLKSAAGTEYDTEIYSIDLAAASTVDILSTDINLPLANGDAIEVTYANTDKITLGIQVILSSGGD